MPRKGSPYGPAYERARERLLARRPRCWWPGCNALATEADHDPPLAFHQHREGSGCCRLRPACGPHQRRQGGLIRTGRGGSVTLGDDPDQFVEVEEPEFGYGAGDPVWDVPWLDDLREVPEDAVWPRFMSAPHPRAVGSLGREFEWWAATHRGTRLWWWQRLVARRLLEVDEHGELVWGTMLLTLARQLGKSWLLWLVLAWRLHQGERFGERQALVHQSIAKGQAASVLEREVPFAEGRPDLYDVDVGKSKQGDVGISLLGDGSYWDVVSTGTSRSGGAYGRSSVVMGVVDEAWAIEATVVDDGLEPTLLQGVQPQLLLVSTAHRRATSLMMARRHLALADLASVDGQALLVEWSAPRDADLEDVSAWRMASPHWGKQREQRIRGLVQRALLGIASNDDDGMTPTDAVRAQYLNQWPLGIVSLARTEPLLPVGAWASCPRSPDGAAVERLWVAIEENAGRDAAVAVVARIGDELFEVDGWLCPSLDEARRSREEVVKFHGVPAVRIEGASFREKSTVKRAGAAELRAGLARLRAALAAGRIVHDDTPEIDAQLADARVRETAGGLILVSQLGKPTHLVRALVWAVRAATLRSPSPAIR